MSSLSAKTDSRFRTVGPIVEFVLLIVPVVMNGFFLVYGLTGWVLEGRDRLNWSLEAGEVALWVCAGILVWSLLVVLYTRIRLGHFVHRLVVSSAVHAVLALMLTISVLFALRL